MSETTKNALIKGLSQINGTAVNATDCSNSLTLTLIYDRDFQYPVSYSNDPYICKSSQKSAASKDSGNKQTNKQMDTTNHVLPYTITRSVIILPRNHIANFTLQAHFLYSRTQTRRQGAALGAYTLGIVELCDYARA